MNNNKQLAQSLATKALDTTFEKKQEITSKETLQDTIPNLEPLYSKFQDTYARGRLSDELIVCDNFTDKNVIEEFNKNPENKPVIKDYIDNIKAEIAHIGDSTSLDVLSTLVKQTKEQNPEVTERMLITLKDPSQAATELTNSVGHSLIQTYGGLGDLSTRQAYAWYYNKLAMGPSRALSDYSDAVVVKAISINEQASSRALEIAASNDASTKEQLREVIDQLNYSYFPEILDLTNFKGLFQFMTDNKFIFGSGALASATAVSVYFMKNPEVAVTWYKFLASEAAKIVGSSAAKTGPRKTFRRASEIQTAEALSKMDTSRLIEQLFDRFILGIKNTFFRK